MNSNMKINITKEIFFIDPKIFEKNIFYIGVEKGPNTEKIIFEAFKFFNINLYRNFNHIKYLNKLTDEILIKKPSIAALRAANRLRSEN